MERVTKLCGLFTIYSIPSVREKESHFILVRVLRNVKKSRWKKLSGLWVSLAPYDVGLQSSPLYEQRPVLALPYRALQSEHHMDWQSSGPPQSSSYVQPSSAQKPFAHPEYAAPNGQSLCYPPEPLDPQDDDGLSSPTTHSMNSQSPSENKALNERKQRSVAKFMGENKYFRPVSRKQVVSDKQGSDVEKSTTTHDGELKGVGGVQPSSTGKRGTKRMADDSMSPMITYTQDEGADGVNGGILSQKSKKIKVSSAEDASEARGI